MMNTSVTDLNFTSDSFSFKLCVNVIHAGMVTAILAYSLVFVVGTPAYSWFFWIYVHAGRKIKPTQVFSMNLTILELIFCIQCAVHVLNSLLFDNDRLWLVIFTVFCLTYIGRPLMQICICVEQYLAVLHPIMFLRYNDLWYRIVIAAVVWMMVCIFIVYEIYIYSFTEYIIDSVFFISVIIISFCCVSVLRALKQPGPGDTQIPMERGRDVGNQQKRNAFNTIFSGLLIILISYLPQVSLSFISKIQIDLELFHCDIAPFFASFNSWGMMITLVQKMYKKV